MKRIFSVCILFSLSIAPIYPSSLDDFAGDVEAEIESNRKKNNEPEYSAEKGPKTEDEFYRDEFNDDGTWRKDDPTPIEVFLGMLYITGKLFSGTKPAASSKSRFTQDSIIYKSFPYSGLRSTYYNVDSPYAFPVSDLMYDESKRDYTVSEYQKFREETYLGERVALKDHLFILDGSYRFVSSDTMGGKINFMSRFGSIAGVETGYTRYHDSDDYVSLFHFGLNYGIYQSKKFMLDGLLFYSNARSSRFNIMNEHGKSNKSSLHLDGISLGGRARLFPVKPLIITAKMEYRQFDDISFISLESETGYMINRYEFFAGYEFLFSGNSELNNIYFGTRIYF